MAHKRRKAKTHHPGRSSDPSERPQLPRPSYKLQPGRGGTAQRPARLPGHGMR